MKVFRLGRQDNFRSMTVFHALARAGIEGLVLVEPERNFLCLGFFDDARAMVDFEFCADNDIPVMRREVGGGVVLLGPGQLFYQLIIKRGDTRMPFLVGEAYRKFSLAPIGVYRRLGIEVFYKPINDLVTAEGRKISGQGAADIGPCFVYVGNILLNFDPWLMSRCLKVPEEKFRDKLRRSMEKNLTWVGRELAALPHLEDVERTLREEFERLMGPLEDEEIPSEVWEHADSLARHFTSRDFVFMDTPRRHSTIKVKEGLYLRHGLYKSAGGVIRAEVEIENGRIENLAISGDFTTFSRSMFSSLSDALKGVDFDFGRVNQRVTEFLENHLAQCRGITPEDFALAIVGEEGGL